ncbi:MAG: sugar phosphate isomerase/epimerase [Chloroflexi bacterium]|nr:sugar phosphate isomerase/epimerase [Chloroflexota bacterium]
MRTCIFTAIFKEQPLEFAASEAARIGYEALELRALSHLPLDSSPARVREVRRIIQGHGLDVVGIYARGGSYANLSDAACQEQLDHLKRYVEMGAELGAGFVVDWPGGPPPAQAQATDWARAAHWLGLAADGAAAAGLRIALELHFGGLVETADDGLKMLDLIGRDNVGLIYDAGNLHLTPAPYGPEVIRRLGSRIIHFHVKDEALRGEPGDPSRGEMFGRVFWHRFLGEGEVDHQPLFRAMQGIGYQGYLSVECHAAGPSPSYVAEKELAAVKRMLSRLAV